MGTYDVTVERDGRWWMITVPQIDQVTQARRIDEIEEMARSLISISTDSPLDDITVNIRNIVVPDVGDVAVMAHQIAGLRNEARRLEAESAEATKKFVIQLTRNDVPVRDAAALLHVSPQRISQLANS